jgi:hypothetical protein
MTHQRGNVALLATILIASAVLLGWSVVSTWQSAKAHVVAAGSINAATAESLPPRLDSDEAKASLFYPVMKSRGPQPGGKLVVRPLDGPRGP